MKIKKELYFGFSLMALILAGTGYMLIAAPSVTNGHLGLMMLALVVVAIMMGFPTAFTLMGMGMIFTWIAYERDMNKTLTLMVQSAFKVMSNDVLISIPLFVFMGYLVERANLIEKLFRSLHLAMARVPGSLAVATLVTCAVFATATGIVGAVVTLMGLLAFPQMLRAGYDTKLAAGAITAGGCLGILIPPSVMLIVYGATAGVSVVQLYAGALFPGIMLATLYIVYVIIIAKLKPEMAPPLPMNERHIDLPAMSQKLLQGVATGVQTRAVPALLSGLRGSRNSGVSIGHILRQLGIALMPLALFLVVAGMSYRAATAPKIVEEVPASLVSTNEGSSVAEPANAEKSSASSGGLAEPPSDDKAEKKEATPGLAEPPSSDQPAATTTATSGVSEPPNTPAAPATPDATASTQAPSKPAAEAPRVPAGTGFWIGLGVGAFALALFYAILSFARLEIFKMLLSSFFPLVVLILAVLGSIVMGLATPTEAAAVGALGGALLAGAYGRLNYGVVKESAFLTAKTSAMVCWLFVGSAIFSAAFALLGGQELVENWVMSMNLTKVEFLILSQVIIFILGWPLEWTEIIVIFMPIFIPLLDNFGVDPLFFGLLVALNLQTAFLSPPVAMAAFYLKGVSPPHVTLNQIFLGMLPFMGIQVIAIILLYMFPAIGMWLPTVLYR